MKSPSMFWDDEPPDARKDFEELRADVEKRSSWDDSSSSESEIFGCSKTSTDESIMKVSKNAEKVAFDRRMP